MQVGEYLITYRDISETLVDCAFRNAVCLFHE